MCSLNISCEMMLFKIRERTQAMLAHIDVDWFKDPTGPKFDPASAWRHEVAISPDWPFNKYFDVSDYSTKRLPIRDVPEIIKAWKEFKCSQGFNPDEDCAVVALDYFERLDLEGLPGVSSKTNDADRAKFGFDFLSTAARDEKVVLWNASQLTKAGVGREVLTQSHCAHAFHKIDATDLTIGLAKVINTDAVVQQYGNSDDEEGRMGKTCDQELKCSIQKARDGSLIDVSFPFYQGATLRYWHAKAEFTRVSGELLGKRDVDHMFNILYRSAKRAK